MVRITKIQKLTLKRMLDNYKQFEKLPEALSKLGLPDKIKIAGKKYDIPTNLKEFSDNICYGQRLFFVRDEENDVGVILRLIDGYYYPIVSGEKWDWDNALLFGKIVLNCTVNELYPVAMHFTKLLKEMADREHELLFREPTKLEKAAGIERLNAFSEMSALDYLRDSMKVTSKEVMLTPYNECLVRFMMARETMDYQERYTELLKEAHSAKKKRHGKEVL